MFFQKILFGKHLEKGEKIFYVAHKHWAVVAKPMLKIALFGYLFPWTLYLIGFNSDIFSTIAIIWTIISVIITIYVFTDWYCDAWLITSGGVIDVEWNGFFHNTSNRTSFDVIDSVGFEIKGFWPTVLRYGKIEANLDSGNTIDLDKAANPKKVEMQILKWQEKTSDDKEKNDEEGIKKILSSIVAREIHKAKVE